MQHMEVLWVQWFSLVPGHWFGSKVELPKIGFIPDMDPLAFRFLDPSLVICGCHLIPAFNDGCIMELLTASPTAGQPPDETDDWAMFFVNMFVFLLVYVTSLFSNQKKTSTDLWIGICICTKREEE